MKYILGAVVLIALFFSLQSCLKSASDKISGGVSRDIDREISMEGSNTYIDPDNPLKGILSERGMFRETGKELKNEGNKVGNSIENLITGVFVIIIGGGILFIYLRRNKT